MASEAVNHWRDVLRLEHCPTCGYQLEGLPAEGVCPECGRSYDDKTLVLYGWSRGTHERAMTGTRRSVVGFVALLLFQIFHVTFSPGLRGTAFGYALAAALVAMLLYVFWRRWAARDMPGLVQVHLSAAGCRQLDNPKAGTLPQITPWNALNDVTIGEESDGMWRVRFRRYTSWWSRQHTPVDAVVRCTAAQGWALRDRIAGWRAVAGSGAETST